MRSVDDKETRQTWDALTLDDIPYDDTNVKELEKNHQQRPPPRQIQRVEKVLQEQPQQITRVPPQQIQKIKQI